MKLKRLASLLLAVVMLVCACTGCGQTAQTPDDGAAKDTLTISGGDITTFNPYMATNGPDIYFMMHIIGESLVLCDNDFNYEPLLAESFEMSEDGLSYTFHLRQGVTFHDGSALDSADVKYSLESAAAGMTAYTLGNYITSIDTPDELTVVVNMSSYMSTFLMTLFSYVPIMPEGIFESGYDFEGHPIGTGPYEFVSYTPGDSLTLKKYEGYYLDDCASIENIKYRVISDSTTALVSLETGDLDWLHIAPSDISLVEGNDELQMDTFYLYSTIIAWMDNAVAPFDDVNVRLALNHAVDRATLAAVKGDRGFSPAATYVSPCCYGFSDDFEPYSYDVELAKQLLSESKYDPAQIAFTITTTEENKVEAQFLQEAFRAIGIEGVNIETVEPSTFQAGIMTKQYPFGLTIVGCGLTASAASLLFASASPVNMMNYNNPDVDAAYATADTTLDETECLSALHSIDEMITADAPCLPLLWYNDIVVYHKGVNMDRALRYACATTDILPQFVEFTAE